jgi:hypothetical protein
MLLPIQHPLHAGTLWVASVCLIAGRICMKVADIVQYGDASARMVNLTGHSGAKVIVSRSDAHYQAGPSSNAPLEKISIPDAEHRRLMPLNVRKLDFSGSLMTSGMLGSAACASWALSAHNSI